MSLLSTAIFTASLVGAACTGNLQDSNAAMQNTVSKPITFSTIQKEDLSSLKNNSKIQQLLKQCGITDETLGSLISGGSIVIRPNCDPDSPGFNKPGSGPSEDTNKPGDDNNSEDTDKPGNDNGSEDTDKPGNDNGSEDTDKPGNDNGSEDTDKPGDDNNSEDTDKPGNDNGSEDTDKPGNDNGSEDTDKPGDDNGSGDTDKPGDDNNSEDTDKPGDDNNSGNTGKPDSDKPGQNNPGNPNRPGGDTSEDNDSNTNSGYASQVIRLVNEERAKYNLSPLATGQNITNAAQTRAREIVSSFSHTRPNGTSFSTALKEQNVSYRGSGENIAWGQRTPEEVVRGWMNSPGHRANILNEKFTSIGVGFHVENGRNYWTQLFTY